MRRKTLATALAAVSAALVAGSLGFAGSASADPSSGQTYTTVGSNTTQNILADLANQKIVPAGTKSAPAGTLSNVGSYEATPTGTNITPKCGVTFPRPNGSGNGVAALSASINGGAGKTFMGKTITGCVQFARSSGGPSVSGTDLTYVPFARDAVGYIYVQNGGTSLASLTKAQLQSYYNGNQPISGIKVTPYIPQSGSGTRAFFLKVIGVTTLGADVNQSSSNEENTASVIGNLTLASGTGAIYPFSISDYISQNNGYSFNTGLSKVSLGHPDGVNPTSAGSGFGQLAPNTTFYSSTSAYARDVYNVFRTSEITAYEACGTDALLSQFIIRTNSKCQVLTPTINNATSQADIETFGFLTVSYSGEVGVSTAPEGAFTYAP